MTTLRTHFAGAGNDTRNKAEADRLHDSLHYKSERSMAFEVFLTNCEKMYNIYNKEGEPWPEDRKIRYLIKKVQHEKLQSAIDALQVQQTVGNAFTYAQATSYLSTRVSELPEYLAKHRSISGVSTAPSGGSSSIYNRNGNIITRYIANWGSLSKADKETVIAERKRLGIKGGKNGKSGNGNADYKQMQNQLKQYKESSQKYKRQIKALKRKRNAGDNNDNAENEDDGNDDESAQDAGDEMGGRNSRRGGGRGNNRG